MFPDLVVQQVYATEPPTAPLEALVQTTAQPVVVDVGELTALMLVWVLVICAVVQALKYTYLVVVPHGKKQRRYRRAVPLLPLLVGACSGPIMGPSVAGALAFVIEPALGVGVGFAAGMVAGWAWVLGRRVVLPIVLAVAPEATKQVLVKLLARVGIDVADVAHLADVSLDIPRAELGLEEPTE